MRISLTDLRGKWLGLCVGVACFVVFGGFFVGFFLLGKFDFNQMLIPVVDRPCLALVPQCREKKKEKKNLEWGNESLMETEEIWIFGALCLYWCDVELHI